MLFLTFICISYQNFTTCQYKLKECGGSLLYILLGARKVVIGLFSYTGHTVSVFIAYLTLQSHFAITLQKWSSGNYSPIAFHHNGYHRNYRHIYLIQVTTALTDARVVIGSVRAAQLFDD